MEDMEHTSDHPEGRSTLAVQKSQRVMTMVQHVNHAMTKREAATDELN